MSYEIDNTKCDDSVCIVIDNLSKCQRICPATGDQPGGAIQKSGSDYSIVYPACINCGLCALPECCPQQAISEV